MQSSALSQPHPPHPGRSGPHNEATSGPLPTLFTARPKRVVADRCEDPLSPPRGTWPSAQGKALLVPVVPSPPAAPPQGSVKCLANRTFVCRPAPALQSTGQRDVGLHESHQKNSPPTHCLPTSLAQVGTLLGPEPPHPAAAEGKHLSAHIRGSGKGGVLAQQPPCSTLPGALGSSCIPRAEHYPPRALSLG